MKQESRKRFSPEFKVETAQLVLDQGYTAREAADAMGVGLSTIGKWVQKLRAERSGKGTIGKPISEEQREIAALRKQVKQLELEKEILKKASALLMSDSMRGSR